MFGGPGKTMYTYFGGLSQTEDSLGFDHAVYSVPRDLVEQAALGNVPENFTSSPPMEFASTSYNTLKGTHAFSWSIEKPTGNSNCASGGESEKLGLSCGASKIEAILFAG